MADNNIRPELVVQLVQARLITETCIGLLERRLLCKRFQLGLFDNPFVDTMQASQVVGRADSQATADTSQRRAITLLKNQNRVLPLSGQPKLFVRIIDPAVIPEISDKAQALLADFGANYTAVLDVVFGRDKPRGKLPFALPSSMAAERSQKEDGPCESQDPLFAFGFGLTYSHKS